MTGRVPLATCRRTTTHSSLCVLGPLPEPSALYPSGCGAGVGQCVGPGTSSGCGLAETHIHQGLDTLPQGGLWVIPPTPA